jgi:hypothetical protein
MYEIPGRERILVLFRDFIKKIARYFGTRNEND